MALRTSLTTDITHMLHLLSRDMEAVREILDEWDTLPDIERMVWTREWEQMVSHIYMLGNLRAAGNMDTDQESAFDCLIKEIHQLAPAILIRRWVLPEVVVASLTRAVGDDELRHPAEDSIAHGA